MNGVNDISLVFNEDGTGAYNFLTEKNVRRMDEEIKPRRVIGNGM